MVRAWRFRDIPRRVKDGCFQPETASSRAAVGPDLRVHGLIPLAIAALSSGGKNSNRTGDSHAFSR